MTAPVDLRLASIEPCDEGHPQLIFDAIVGGTLYPIGIRLHAGEPGAVDVLLRRGVGPLIGDEAAQALADLSVVCARDRDWPPVRGLVVGPYRLQGDDA